MLDWFHITMRLTVLRQMTKSLPATDGPDASAVVSVAKADDELTRAKWLLWHGNTFRALQVLDDLCSGLEHQQDDRHSCGPPNCPPC